MENPRQADVRPVGGGVVSGEPHGSSSDGERPAADAKQMNHDAAARRGAPLVPNEAAEHVGVTARGRGRAPS